MAIDLACVILFVPAALATVIVDGVVIVTAPIASWCVKLVLSFTILNWSNSTCGVYVSTVNAKLEKVTEPAPLRVSVSSVLLLESFKRTVNVSPL